MGRQGTRQYDETAGGVRSIRRRRGLPGGLAGAAALALLAGLGLQAPPAYAVTGGGAQFDTWATWASNTGGFAAPQGTHWARRRRPGLVCRERRLGRCRDRRQLAGVVVRFPVFGHSPRDGVVGPGDHARQRLHKHRRRGPGREPAAVVGADPDQFVAIRDGRRPGRGLHQAGDHDSGNAVHIAAAGSDGSLWFFWAWNGAAPGTRIRSPGREPVASYDAPTMTEYGGMTQIAATTATAGWTSGGSLTTPRPGITSRSPGRWQSPPPPRW